MTSVTAKNVAEDHDTNVNLLTAPTVSFVIAAEGGDEIDVLLQLEDGDGDAVEEFAHLRVWLTDSQGADEDISTGAPSAGIDISGSGEGVIVNHTVADLLMECVTDTNGQIEFTIGEAGAATWYMNVALPGGGIVVSDAITFAP